MRLPFLALLHHTSSECMGGHLHRTYKAAEVRARSVQVKVSLSINGSEYHMVIQMIFGSLPTTYIINALLIIGQRVAVYPMFTNIVKVSQRAPIQ